ncbi:hypothetical protein V6N12_002619 [Hibiscus sabdariffa]|uniref:Uncharacterized protein n=1 Tax=Hibiscus sabdariffa TaxID=183260 RepID=A0ABR2ED19_9ROSI
MCELVIEAGFRGHWLVEGEINVFVEHSVDVPDFIEAPLAIEAPIVTHEQGKNRDNTLKEGKTVAESEVIDTSEGVEEEDKSGGVEEEGISERSGEVKEGIPPSFERDYEAYRSGGDEDEKDEDDILEDVEWVKIDDIVDQVRRRRVAVKEKTTTESNGAGSEIDYIDSSNLGSYETDDDGEVHCKKSKVCCFDPTDPVPCFQLGWCLRTVNSSNQH